MAADSEQSTNTDLGRRLRELRKERHLSLKELCARAQLSVAMLSHIERNETNPSLKMLEKICAGLGVEMAESLPDPGRGRNRRGSLCDSFQRSSLAELALPHGVTKQLLSPSHKRTLELFILKVAPNGSSGAEPLIRTGEKGGMLLKGRIRLAVGSRSIEEGDSFLFDSALPHRFFNPGSVEAHILWIIRPNPVSNEL